MLKGKQRAYLRSLANTLKPTTQIGKEGVTESFLEQLDGMLRTRELVKVTILENAGLDTKETANAVCEALRAEFVQAIGFKFTIYKRNIEEPKILFPGHEQAKAKAKTKNNNVTKKGKPTKRAVR
ncbi:YhbY family RNA-binding protein [Clostridioides difficile]|nr:YhbY family RNA-binding protein [Clostridioides difficile]